MFVKAFSASVSKSITFLEARMQFPNVPFCIVIGIDGFLQVRPMIYATPQGQVLNMIGDDAVVSWVDEYQLCRDTVITWCEYFKAPFNKSASIVLDGFKVAPPRDAPVGPAVLYPTVDCSPWTEAVAKKIQGEILNICSLRSHHSSVEADLVKLCLRDALNVGANPERIR